MRFGTLLGARSRLGGAWLGAVVALGCAGTQEKPAERAKTEAAPAWDVSSTTCDASASMPPPVKERQVREGRVLARVAWSVDEDGSRYEIACFDGPELTTASDRAGLVAMIEERISNSPGVKITGRQSAQKTHLEALELEVSFPEDRVGRYWIFLIAGRRLFEVSVVGPPSERLAQGSERFFSSFKIGPSSPSK